MPLSSGPCFGQNLWDHREDPALEKSHGDCHLPLVITQARNLSAQDKEENKNTCIANTQR